MSFILEYENLIQEINEDIEAGIVTVNDYIKVVRKRKIGPDDYCPIKDYYYADNHPNVKVEQMQVGEVLKELTLRNMMR
ncbi:MAG: hypothetical protein L6276_11325 [Acetobacterium sp.]|nr:hypothetical protein [uncultured Acetobacterium sp.]MBU4439396.1 hypothetical protein [Bacillota bacterium]MCG2730846.1 hypothetical protein [Acetobacterium sp.]